MSEPVAIAAFAVFGAILGFVADRLSRSVAGA